MHNARMRERVFNFFATPSTIFAIRRIQGRSCMYIARLHATLIHQLCFYVAFLSIPSSYLMLI